MDSRTWLLLLSAGSLTAPGLVLWMCDLPSHAWLNASAILYPGLWGLTRPFCNNPCCSPFLSGTHTSFHTSSPAPLASVHAHQKAHSAFPNPCCCLRSAWVRLLSVYLWGPVLPGGQALVIFSCSFSSRNNICVGL